ncbi:metallophosphoesterase [Candidatus Uhrbacteria bacterium]|nr:metallophosphoesterase [Candidatus Uhrbacteria bacterium]
MSEQAIFASDLHGNKYAYDRLFSMAAQEGIRTVILGGDLTPKWPILSFSGQSLIPLTPKHFRPDENGHTYVRFLEEIELLVKKKHEAEKHFVGLGGFIVHTGKSMSWKNLFSEQKILCRILEGPSERTASIGKVRFIISDEEWRYFEHALNRVKMNPGIDKETILKAFRAKTLSLEHEKRLGLVRTALWQTAKELLQCEPAEVQRCLAGLQELYTNTPEVRVSTDSVKSFALSAAQLHPLKTWADKARELHRAIQPQKNFIKYYLASRIKKFKEDVPGGRVLLILGNDDVVECRESIERLEHKGLITSISERTVELGNGLKIAGYPFVHMGEGLFYRGWDKPEEEIEGELSKLETGSDPEKTIFVVHTPPAQTHLDQSFNDNHYGSLGMRRWLGKSRKHLVLSGHIHEAPFLNGGVWRETVDGTLCMQPGAWHDQGLCAIIFDLENPGQAHWIHNE